MLRYQGEIAGTAAGMQAATRAGVRDHGRATRSIVSPGSVCAAAAFLLGCGGGSLTGTGGAGGGGDIHTGAAGVIGTSGIAGDRGSGGIVGDTGAAGFISTGSGG